MREAVTSTSSAAAPNRRRRGITLAMLGGLLVAGVLGSVAQALNRPAFAATASLVPFEGHFVGDKVGTRYDFLVNNSGSSTDIGAVQIARPGTAWSVTKCPVAPAGWTSSHTSSACRFVSKSTHSDDIKPGQRRSFSVFATTAASRTNRVGTWHVTVSRSTSFGASNIKAAAATGGGLSAKLFSIGIRYVVLADAPVAAGRACPAPRTSAYVGSTKVLVVCGDNHASASLTPTASYLRLAGTALAHPGRLSSAAIRPGSGPVVLASVTGTKMSGTLGRNREILIQLGASSSQTSAYRRIGGYSIISHPPVARADSYKVNGVHQLVVAAPGVLGNDSDADHDTLHAALAVKPVHGVVSFHSNGSFTYTPGASYNGADSFRYRASDGHTSSAATLVSLSGPPVKHAPVAVADAGSTDEDSPVTLNVVSNDTDQDAGDTLVVGSVDTTGTQGTVAIDPAGTVTYDPNGAFEGLGTGDTATDTFKYTVSDGHGGTSTTTVTITVNGVNDAPSASNVTDGTDEDTALPVTLSGSDADADALAFSIVAAPLHGSLGLPGAPSCAGTGCTAAITYTPNANYNGPDSFTYKVNDGTVDSGPATVSLTVTAVNDAASAVNDSYNTNEDTQLNMAAPGVLGNDSDLESDPVTAVLNQGPAHASAFALNADGSFSYTPAANYNGPDSFSYKANDGHTDSSAATVSLTVTAVDDDPVAVDDTPSVSEDSTGTTVNVLANDIDDGTLTISGVDTTGTSGTVTNNGTDITYDPNGMFESLGTGQTTVDTFTYTISDGSAPGDTATVNITITGVNDPPVAVDDVASTDEASTKLVNVVTNDSDDEGAFSVTAVSATTNGGSVVDNNDGTVTYDPNGAFEGLAAGEPDTDTFTYTITDGQGATDTATVTVTINGINDAPDAVIDSPSVSEDSTGDTVDVLANDTDAESQTLTVTGVDTTGTTGTVTNNGTDVTYDPNGQFESLTTGETDTDSFTYTISDGHGGTDTATVNITIDGASDLPVAVNDTGSTDEASTKLLSVLTNDSDAEGPVTISGVDTTVTSGTVTDNGDGTLTYDPNGQFEDLAAGESRDDTFTYTIKDSDTNTDTATVKVTVNGINDAPNAIDDPKSVSENSTGDTVDVLGNDTDAEGQTLTVTGVDTTGTAGIVTNNGTDVTYDPNGNFESLAAGETDTDSFTYTISDGHGGTDTATVNITITGVNDPPVALDDGYQVVQDNQLVVTMPGVLGNDTDADTSDTLTAGNASDPVHGTVVLASDGSFTYTPTAAYTGPDTFSYDVSDGTGTDSATVTITVVPPNATPNAGATSASGNEDAGAIQVTLTGHDADNDNLTFAAGTATNGTVGTPSSIDCTALNDCTATVTYTPNANYFGPDSFTYTVNDGTIGSAPATASITVNPVNDAPSFTKGADQTVNEDSGAQAVSGWAAPISAGPANEGAQIVTFVASTNNDPLFSSLPAVSSNGTLTYTPAVNAKGSATVTIHAHDDGGTANSGVDDSANQTFSINVTSVNDAPSFTKGADLTGPDAVLEDAGAQSVSGWATAISKGPANEASQALNFLVTNNTNTGLFSVQPSVSPTGVLAFTGAPNQYGTATVTLALHDDGGTANGGADTSPTQSFVITINPVNDAPVAAVKSYTVQANMTISLGGLLTGSTDPNDNPVPVGQPAYSPSYSVGVITVGAGCAGCTVANVDTAAGTFDFSPPPGGTGPFTVTYTVVDTGYPAPGVSSAAQTITFNVSGPVIWFADAVSGDDALGLGTLAKPYKTLSKVASVDGANDRVFLYSGSYADPFTLNSGEWLTGAGSTGTGFDTLMGISPPAGTMARPAIGGAAPTVSSTVTLGTNNTVRGLTLNGAPALTGLNFGTLSLGLLGGTGPDVALSSTGQALNLDTGTVSGDLVSTSSSGGTNNVNLNAVTAAAPGTSLGSGSLSGGTVDGLRINAGGGVFSYQGTISHGGTGAAVLVSSRSSGSVTIGNSVTTTAGTGVSMTNNTGSIIALNGPLTLVTGASPGLVATGGGTVHATNANNTITTTSGTAINVANTTIGSTNLVFKKVDVNISGAAAPASGIILNNTGTAGHLVVTGTGTTAASGGLIRATSGVGIALTSSKDVALSNLKVQDTGSHGLQGTSVNGLTLTNVEVAGAGDADNERAVDLTNTTGTLAISGGSYSDASDDLVHFQNSNLNATVTINGGATFKDLTSTFANNAIELVPNGTSAINASITNSTFTNLKNSSLTAAASTLGSNGASSLTFTGNTVSGGAQGGAGVLISGQELTTTTAIVSNNSFTGAGGNGVISADTNDKSTLLLTATNNTVGSPHGHGIVAAVDEEADIRALITGNTITNAGGDGIELTNFGDDSASAFTSTANWIVRNNTINGHSLDPATAFVGGIGIFHFENDADTTCAAVTGNAVTGTPASYFDIYLQDNTPGSGKFTFEENPNTATSGQVLAAYIAAQNPATSAANDSNSGAVYSNGALCQVP